MGQELWQLSQESLKVTATSCPHEEVEGAFLGRAGFRGVPHAYAWACTCVQVVQCVGACCMHVGVSMFVYVKTVCGSAAVSHF